jgi:hypothetical protein
MKTIFTTILLSFIFSISAQVTASAGPDQEICIFDTLFIKGSGLNAGDTGSYQWKDLNTNNVISLNQSFGINILSMTKRSYELTVTKKTSGKTYYAYDTMEVTINALPTFSFKGIPPRCYADGALNLTSNSIVTAYSGDKSQQEQDIRYFQKYKSPSWITGGPVGQNPYIYDFSKYISNSQIPKSTGYRDTICYEYQDYKGCYNNECRALKLNPNPVVSLTSGEFCQRAGLITLDNLVVQPFNRAGGIQSFRCISVPAGSGVDPATIITVDNSKVPALSVLNIGKDSEHQKTGEYVIEYCFKDVITGCQSCDTTTVRAITLPLIKFSSIPLQCINGPLLALDSLLKDANTGKRMPDALWKTVEYGGSRDMSNPNVAGKLNNSVRQNKYFDPGQGSGQYLVKVIDVSAGCPISDSIVILTNGLPIIQIDVPDTVCSNETPFTLKNVVPSGPVGTWSGTGVNNNTFDPSKVSTSTRTVRSMLKYVYTHPLTTCTSSDSQSILVQNQARFVINANPKSNVRYMVDFNLSQTALLDTGKAKFSWDFGSSGTSTKVNPDNVFFADSGEHTAYLHISEGICDIYDSIKFDLNYKTVGIIDLARLLWFYPNPVADILHVEMPIDGTIAVCDINGKQLLSRAHTSGIVSSLNLAGLEPGVYLVSVSGNEQIVWRKIVVQ